MNIHSLCKPLSISYLALALLGAGLPVPVAEAGGIVVPVMPAPGTRAALSQAFAEPHVQGLTIHRAAPFKFDFLVYRGANPLTHAEKNPEYTKLIKYFLAALTVSDADQWVNLSPYEKGRIVPDAFGKTQMGRDLLAQDYLLKQLTSSLMYPETGLGRTFWDKVYAKAWEQFKTTNVPVDTFNKVWIVPDQAAVYESGDTVYILRTHLKVMLEEDYLAISNSVIPATFGSTRYEGAKAGIHSKMDARLKHSGMTREVIRDVILPILEKEVNEGKNFAPLRQVVSSMVLATWYKKALKDSILTQVYADKSKVEGLLPTRGHVLTKTTKNVSPSRLPSNDGLNAKATQADPFDVDAIYHRYLEAFKKGVYNYIKEDEDKYTHQSIARKYFAGGFKNPGTVTRYDAAHVPDAAMLTGLPVEQDLDRAAVSIEPAGGGEERRARLQAVADDLIGKVMAHPAQVRQIFEPKQFLSSKENAHVPAEDAEELGRILNEQWSRERRPDMLGSIFDMVPLHTTSSLYLHFNHSRDIVQWMFRFLRGAPALQRALALHTFITDNNSHLHFIGLHPEGTYSLDNVAFVDNENLLGYNLPTGAVQEYFFAVAALKETPDFNNILPGPDGRPNALHVTAKDVMLWGLVLALDPTIHSPALQNDEAASNINLDHLSASYGEGLTQYNVMVRAMQTALAKIPADVLSSLEPLVIEALSRTDGEWAAKGLVSPYRFVSSKSLGELLLEEPSPEGWSQVPLQDKARFYVLEPRFWPEGLSTWAAPRRDSNTHRVLGVSPAGTRKFFAQVYRHPALTRLMPHLPEAFEQTGRFRMVSLELFRPPDMERIEELRQKGVLQFVLTDAPYFASRLQGLLLNGFSWKKLKRLFIDKPDLLAIDMPAEEIVRTVAANGRSQSTLDRRLAQAAAQAPRIFVVSGGGIAQKIFGRFSAVFRWPVSSSRLLARDLTSQGLVPPGTEVMAAWNPNIGKDTVARVQQKIRSGAGTIITQPPFLWDPFKEKLQNLLYEERGTRVLVGVPVIGSSREARIWMQNVFGPTAWKKVPEARGLVRLFEMKEASLDKEQLNQFKVQWAIDLIRRIEDEMPEVAGIHLMPVNQKTAGDRVLEWLQLRREAQETVEYLKAQGIQVHVNPVLLRDERYTRALHDASLAMARVLENFRREGKRHGLPALEVQFNRIIQRHHFVPSVAVRRITGGAAAAVELFVDLRQLQGGDVLGLEMLFQDRITAGLEGKAPAGVMLEPMHPTDQGIAWAFNAAFWGDVKRFMAAKGQDYRASIGGSPDTNPALVRDTAERVFFALQKALYDDAGGTQRPFAYVEVGVASPDHVELLIKQLQALAQEKDAEELLSPRYLQFVLTDFSKAILEETEAKLQKDLGELYDRVNIQYVLADTKDPLSVLRQYKGRIINYHATNVFDNLPTLQIARKQGIYYEVHSRLYLPEDSIDALVKGRPFSKEDLRADLRGITTTTVPVFLEKYRLKFGEDAQGFYNFWQDLWHALKFDEEYVPLVEWSKFDYLGDKRSGNDLRAYLDKSQKGDFKTFISSEAIKSLRQVIPFLHRDGSIEVVDMMVRGLRGYGPASDPQIFVPYDGSLATRLNAPVMVYFLSGKRNANPVITPLSRFGDPVPVRALMVIPNDMAMAAASGETSPGMDRALEDIMSEVRLHAADGTTKTMSAFLHDSLLSIDEMPGFDEENMEVYDLVDERDARAFGLKLSAAWKAGGFEGRYGSVFNWGALYLSGKITSTLRYYKSHRWLSRFLQAAPANERVSAFWLSLVSNTAHLRHLGMHTENEGDGDHFVDNDVILGQARNEGLLAGFLEAVREYKALPEFNAPLPGKDGRPNAIGLTPKDLVMWGLVLVLDPTIHAPFRSVEHSPDYLLALLRKKYGPDATFNSVMVSALMEGFNNVSPELLSDMEPLMAEALSVTPEQWRKKGLRSPYTFAMGRGMADPFMVSTEGPAGWEGYPLRDPFWIYALAVPPVQVRDIFVIDEEEGYHRSLKYHPEGLQQYYRQVYTSKPLADRLTQVAAALNRAPVAADAAQTTQQAPGGIDLNAAHWDLAIKRGASTGLSTGASPSLGKGSPGIHLLTGRHDLAQWAGLSGLVPHIIDIQRVESLPILDELRRSIP